MPKKDTASAVLGMLSTVGSQTRATVPATPDVSVGSLAPGASGAPVDPPAERTDQLRPAATVSSLPPVSNTAEEDAPERCGYGRRRHSSCGRPGWRPNATTCCSRRRTSRRRCSTRR